MYFSCDAVRVVGNRENVRRRPSRAGVLLQPGVTVALTTAVENFPSFSVTGSTPRLR